MTVELKLPIGALTFEDAEELWDFVKSRREYTHVEFRRGPRKKLIYIAIPTSDICILPQFFKKPNLHHFDLRGIGRMAIMLTKQKMALQSLRENYPFEQWLSDALDDAIRSRERIIKRAYQEYQAHPICRWIENISGLGPADAIMFMAFIDPHICTTAGKAFAYWNLAGDKSVRRSGVKTPGDPELRGIAFFMAQRIWMRNDSYYKPLAEAKKEYYLKKLQAKGEKGYRIHAHKRALLWLGHLLVGHAWEIWRRFEGLPTHPHANYVPPKSSPSEEPPEEILKALRNGKRINNTAGET